MTYQGLKLAGRFGTIVGLVLLILGVILFMNNDSGTKQEKFGIILMTYAGMLMTMGFTAWVAWRTRQ